MAVGKLPKLTYILKFNLVLVNFLCNREGSTAEMVIIVVVEAKYEVDKTIVYGLLQMYFPRMFCANM